MKTLEGLKTAAFWTAVYIGRAILGIDKKLYKYFGIETPLYREWWKRHAENVQRELNKQSYMF